jgi:perosamine synthetase
LDENVQYRNQVVRWYRRMLADVNSLEIPSALEGYVHSYYKFPVLLDPAVDKKQLCQRLLTDFQIETGSLYDPPCHLQPVFRRILQSYEGMYPIAESVLRRQICLPIHSQVTESDVSYVSSVLRTVLH